MHAPHAPTAPPPVQVPPQLQSPAEYVAALTHALQAGAAAVKITDFGFSQQLLPGQSHAAGARVGTPFYVAPELLHAAALFPATDVYAFGVMMWELMMGCPVFVRLEEPGTQVPAGAERFERHPGFPQLPASVPLAYSLAMKACLDPCPGDRPTCVDLLRLLDDLAAEVAEGSYVNSKGLIQDSAAVDGLPTDDVSDCSMPMTFDGDTTASLSRVMLHTGFRSALLTARSSHGAAASGAVDSCLTARTTSGAVAAARRGCAVAAAAAAQPPCAAARCGSGDASGVLSRWSSEGPGSGGCEAVGGARCAGPAATAAAEAAAQMGACRVYVPDERACGWAAPSAEAPPGALNDDSTAGVSDDASDGEGWLLGHAALPAALDAQLLRPNSSS